MVNRKILLLLIFTLFIIPNIFSAKLTSFDIYIDIRGPEKAFITEEWRVEYDPTILNDKEKFKEDILLANIDLEKFVKIDPNLKPNIYLRNFSNVSIIFDESKDIISINYEISDLILQNYYETEAEILWKFNENLLRNLIVNNLYVIPSNSTLSIKVYDPLVIRDPNPKGTVEKNLISWSSLSSNEMKVLAYEKKPPKPSFIIVTSQDSDIFYYLILIFIVLLSIILIFKKPFEKSIKNFVIKNSVIKPKKQKKEFVVDSDFFED
jgi:hypothetical protein